MKDNVDFRQATLESFNVTFKEVDTVIRLDNSDPAYMSNKDQYFVACNVWLSLICDYTDPVTTLSLKSRIMHFGLIPVIRDAVDAYTEIMNGVASIEMHGGVDLPSNYDDIYKCIKCLSNDIRYMGSICKGILDRQMRSTDTSFGDYVSSLSHALQFLKRFSVTSRTLQNDCYTQFLRRNKFAKRMDRQEAPHWLILALREKMASYLRGYNPRFNQSLMRFMPTGSTADAGRDLGSKVIECEKYDPLFLGLPYSLESSVNSLGFYNDKPSFMVGEPVKRGDFSRSVEHRVFTSSNCYSVGKAVPKSYKTYRFIAMEQVYRQLHKAVIAEEITRLLDIPGNPAYGKIVLDDQGVDAYAALEGSRDAHLDSNVRLATVDWSAASDSMYSGIMRDILPKEVSSDIDRFRAAKIRVGKQEHTLYNYLTMGARDTFPIESLYFLAVAEVAVDYARLFGAPGATETSFCSVYGDDTIIPSYAVSTLLDFADMLGLTPNADKSYSGSHPFREACGHEYWDGVYITPDLWPRREVTEIDYELLITLQHHVVGFRHAELLVRELVQTAYPMVTQSTIGSDYSDLWVEFPSDIKVSDWRAKDCEQDHILIKHSALVNRPRKCEDKRLVDAVARYRYALFLENGPQYENAFMRLLGVSLKQQAPEYSVLVPTSSVKFTYAEE